MPRSAQDGHREPTTLFDPAATGAGFGPSRFHIPGVCPGGHSVRARTVAKLREKVREHAPRRPGVYGMLDAKGRVVYIGKAKNIRTRLLSYFRESSDPKAGRILSYTRTLGWEHAANEFAALLRELELIQRFRPRFNVLGQPGRKRYVYVCVGRGPAPYAFVTRTPTGKDLGTFGPLVGRGRAEDAARKLNDWFRLRDCTANLTMAFADQKDLFGTDRAAKCLRFDIGTCLGPCAGECTRRGYGAAVRGAKAFLDGRDPSPLAALRGQMAEAAAALQFERATAVRDRLAALEWLDQRLGLLRKARDQNSFVLPMPDHDGRAVWFFVHRGQVVGAAWEPADAEAGAHVAGLVEAAFAGGPVSRAAFDRVLDSVLLVWAWLKKYPADRARVLTPEQAVARCRHPGVVQAEAV